MRTMGLAALASLLAAGCGGEGDTAGAGRGFSVLYQTELDRGADEVPAIFSIRGVASDDVWATGQFGTAVHYDGTRWTKVPTTASGTLSSLTFVGPDAGFALDLLEGEMHQWNGREWAASGGRSGSRLAIWAETPRSVWSVGGVEEHWGGQVWTQVPSNSGAYFGAISATGVAGMFATATDGSVIHFNGTNWAALPIVPREGLYGVWAASTAIAWMVGESGLILLWDGTGATAIDGGTQHDLNAIDGTGPDDIWAGGDAGTVIHFDGTSWSYATTPSGEDINAVWSPRRGEVWIGDVRGTVTRYVP